MSTAAPHPIPIPAPLALGLKAVFGGRHLESVFYESAASDAEEAAARKVAGRRRGATTARRPASASDLGGDGKGAAAAATTATTTLTRPESAADLDGRAPPSPTAGGQPAVPPPTTDDGADEEAAAHARVRTVRRAIIAAGDDLRARHPWLEASQDAIGAGLIVGCVSLNLGLALAFARGSAPFLPVLLLAALAQSILHEVEHDLIHACYFARRWGAGAVNAALAIVYSCRLSTINPWARRALHLHHHAASGTPSDLEERAITNGQPWTFKRFLITGDNLLALLLRPTDSMREFRDYVRDLPSADAATNPGGWAAVRAAHLLANAGGYVPLGIAHYAVWYAGLADAALKWGGFAGFLVPGTLAATAISTYAAAFGAPNALRTFCLHAVSSNIHYVGIRRGDVLHQTQVLTHPATWPLQAFCAGFGFSHATHHFVVRDPFYIRTAITFSVLATMREAGVLFNDFGTLARANRLPVADADKKAA